MATTLQPVFSRISNEERNNYDLFMEYTNPGNIDGYATGWAWDLGKLADLAEKAYRASEKANPILQEGSPQAAVIPGRQWELDRLSDIKQRLSQAIDLKRSYYDNSFPGMITKYVLQFLGMWDNGETAGIVKAEDFLIRYDSRMPLLKLSNGNYVSRCFFPLTNALWVRNNLNIGNFYNYNPQRAIPIVQNFRYDTLDLRDPRIFIQG